MPTPAVKLRRSFDRLSLDLAEMTMTLEEIVKFMDHHQLEVRIPIRLADELARWQAAMDGLRAHVSRVRE